MVWLKDFRMAGYLVARGFMVAGTKFDARGDVELGFEDPEGAVTRALREYGVSAERQYENACKYVHDLIRISLRNR